MSEPWYGVSNEAEIASPALLLFPDRVEANIDLMVKIAGRPERLWPHVKTHKLGQVVALQLARGIRSFKCATIAEAEMTAQAGASEVLLAFPPVGPAVHRLIELQRLLPATRFLVIVDAEEQIAELSRAAMASGTTIPVLLDVDCGMHRTGVAPGPEAIRLYQLVANSSGLEADGLHAYDGHIHEPDLEARTAECDAAFAPIENLRAELLQMRLPVKGLIAGGAPTFPIHARHHDRDLSPGTTVLWDFGYGDKFPDLPFLEAAVLLTRVVSKPGPKRLCLDLGHKAVAADALPPRVRILELPEATVIVHSEEHLVLETPEADRFPIGTCLHGIPRHVCPTVALHSEALVVRQGAAREAWPILARARRLTI